MSMKLLIASLACIFATTAIGAEPSTLSTEKQKFSYTIGFQIAQNIKNRGLDVDAKALAQAIEDVLGGKQPQLSMADMQAAMAAFQRKQLEARAAIATKNQQAGEAYLADNKKKDGVVTLPSGLQYKVMKKASGKKPTVITSYSIHYTKLYEAPETAFATAPTPGAASPPRGYRNCRNWSATRAPPWA